jgi:hypothetical protein
MLITIFITYVKHKIETGEVYVGRTHGEIEVINRSELEKVLRRRDTSHDKNSQGFEKAEIESYSENSDAIRGREQQLIDHYRKQGVLANLINGISPRNKKRLIYMTAAIETFGHIFTLISAFQI